MLSSAKIKRIVYIDAPIHPLHKVPDKYPINLKTIDDTIGLFFSLRKKIYVIIA
jgi:hypothetical protein